MQKLLKSKAFWTGLVDAVIKVALIILQKYYPGYLPIFNDLWMAIQPIVAIIIAAFAVEDIQQRFQAALLLHGK